MSVSHPKAKAGLGGWIFETLANRSHARVEVSDAAPGAAITIRRLNPTAKATTTTAA